MTGSYSPGWASRIVFWVLGISLFLSVGFLPNLLLAWFYTGGAVHQVVFPTVAVLLLLIWGSARLAAAASR